MRYKLLSVILTLILYAGLAVPLVSNNNSGPSQFEQQVLADEVMHTWFHDGSNMTGFASPVAELPTMGSLTSSGEYFYSVDLGSGSGWHGPGMSYALEEPFLVSQLTSFDVEVEFDCLATSGRLGAINVILYDSNELPICRYIVSDAWSDDRQMKLPFSWFFLDESSITTPSSEPAWVTFSPYYDTLTVTNTSNGFRADIPDIGIFDIPVTSAEDLSRVISYVTIRFLAYESYTYCEEVFIHSITLEWSAESTEPSSTTTGSTTTTQTPEQPPGSPFDGLLLPISIGGGAVIVLVIVLIFLKQRGSAGPSRGIAPSGYDW
jgi:hypothetical protein